MIHMRVYDNNRVLLLAFLLLGGVVFVVVALGILLVLSGQYVAAGTSHHILCIYLSLYRYQ
jgi:heme A synthase